MKLDLDDKIRLGLNLSFYQICELRFGVRVASLYFVRCELVLRVGVRVAQNQLAIRSINSQLAEPTRNSQLADYPHPCKL